MTEPVINHLPHSQVEIKFSVSPEEAQPYLDQAVQDITTNKPLKGFRPGKASYNDVKNAYGEMAIWQAAAERIVRAFYVKTILAQNIDTIGSPEVSVEKLVPGQAIEFTTTANVMPQVTNLMEYGQPLVTHKKKTVSSKEVDAAIEELRRMRRTEVAVDRAATKEDAVMIDLEIKKDNVPVEGGNANDYKVYLNEPQYIPGFADKLVGAKKGEVKTFELEFPKDHYNKMLAGNTIEFVATIKDVFEMQPPELNDEFASSVGATSVEDLKAKLLENLQLEQNQKTSEAAEIELLEKLIKGSRFTEVPELLVNEEVRRMYAELQHNAEAQGMKMEDYLASLKKSSDEIKLDFVPRAIERIQTAVLIKEIGNREKVEVDEAEVEKEQDRLLDSLAPSDKETRTRVASPEYKDYIAAQMKNRKVLEALKAKAIKSE